MTTVYLIDDEPILLELLSDVVHLAGMQPQAFTLGSRFFEEVTTFDTDAILVLDLNMPEMDGVEVMRRLANMHDTPALILISGHDTGVLHAAEKLGRAHSLNIVSTLSKPIPIERFMHLLQSQGSSRKLDEPRRNAPMGRELIVAVELRQAIREGQLVLHYQPQFDIATRAFTGVEALVRWQHPEMGLIYPDRFIPLAEQFDLIGDLTRWVIGEVVRQQRCWQNQGLQVSVSANISAIDITSLTLPEQLAELLADNRLDPTRLSLEVTESALMGELVTSLDILTRMRLKGIGLSIDDFGTGYSSLSQLHRAPFTELKIDRSFVMNIVDDAEAKAIVKTCILLGHELNLRVVAEGVETEEHLKLLHELGCDTAQGYLFSKPVPPDEILRSFANGGQRPIRS